MSEIIDQLYAPLLAEHGFIRDSDNQQYLLETFSRSRRRYLLDLWTERPIRY